MPAAPAKGCIFYTQKQKSEDKIIMKHYFSTAMFSALAIMATVATIATGENNFLGTVVFGTFAIGDFWNTTKVLWKRYKSETNYRGKHSRRAA